MTTYYEASFVPPVADYDGRFRTVQVTSIRKDIVLRYRAGYYALAPGTGSAFRPFEAPLLKILAGSSLPNDVQFRAGVLRLGTLQDGNANAVVIEAPLKDLNIREDPNTRLYSLHLSMVAQIKNKAGTVIDHFSQDIPRHGAIESVGTRSDVVTLQRHFTAPPGEYVLEAAVLDVNSEKAGAQRISFEIPETSSSLALSDMALVRRIDPFRADSDPQEPLRYGAAKVVPSLSGEVAKGAKDISIFFIIHPNSAAASVKLEMEVRKNGESLGKMPLPVRSDAHGGTAVPYLGTIQTRLLSPGAYQVVALVSQGDKTAQRTANFTISGADVADVSQGAARSVSSGSADTESASDATKAASAALANTKLVITAPANPIPAPAQEELSSILDDARARALHYAESLPNFSCVEITTRSVDVSGKGTWKHKDAMAQLLTYRDNTESRIMLEVNGARSKVVPGDSKGMTSRGQFGAVLNAVFSPKAKAEFEWKETGVLGTGTVHVFSYRVAEKNSNYSLEGNNHTRLNVAFHGIVYIDAGTLGVRRITLEAENIPRDFSIHASSISVDYDYIVINNHDYLMPIRAVVSIRQGKLEGVLNEIEFRNYRRFGSWVRILGFTKAPPS
jgi:hypothetical protein